MHKQIIEKINNADKVAILGFGREGNSTYNFIRKYLPNKIIYILDEKEISLDDEYTVYKKYNRTTEDLIEFDLIIKTPGISLKDIDTEKIKDKLTSQIELLLEVNKQNVIGITGTKGKSTTSSLIYNIIKDQGRKVFLVGNIGVPALDQIEEYKDALIVTEMSSHQLEFIKTAPHIGIILNLFQDHLDHAGSVKHYHECKMNMLLKQTENDIGIFDADNYYLKEITKDIDFKQKILNVSNEKESDIYVEDNNIYLNGNLLVNANDIKRNILGDHNLKNIMYALLVTSLLNLDFEKAYQTISEFKSLEHRMELVGTYKDIIFYNDSIATIPEAVINACKTLKNVDTLIFGGQDRGIDYTSLIEYLNEGNIRNLICMPTTGFNIADKLTNKNINIYKIETLEEAVTKAFEVTDKNKICLLSPAAPSYEYYKNFEEKGNAYKNFIKEYK